MNKLFYPAIFHTAEEGGFWITFPDFPECITEGDDMEDAYRMAVDAVGFAVNERERAKESVPDASSPESIVVEDGVIVIVEFDMMEYKRRHCSRAVKKTLSIPEWMNEAAIKAGVNFSQVLQEALMEKLNIP